MPSRQDQLQSHQFTVARVVSALVARETDPAQPPFRRLSAAAIAGVLVSALVLAGFAAYGLIAPSGSRSWRHANVVIEEKGTGAKYVYRDGTLYPVLNYASALLAVEGSGARTVSVARGSLDGVPRGALLGITGAPDSLPAAKRLTAKPWTICSRRVDRGVESVLLVGGETPAGSTPNGSLLVSTSDGGQYLIHDRYRHRIAEPDRVTAALLWGNQQSPVATAWVNALPAGQDLRMPNVGDRGQKVARPAGGRVGQVYRFKRSDNAPVEFFLAGTAGLTSLTALEAALLLNDPTTVGSTARTEATELSRADFTQLVNGVQPLAPRDVPGALPATPPELAAVPSGALCAGTGGAGGIAWLRSGVALPASVGTPTAGASTAGTVLADRVLVPPGSGALVESVSSATAGAGQVCVITDLGVAYVLPREDARARLGYGGAKPVRMPAELVALLPRGPSLDPTVAMAPVVR